MFAQIDQNNNMDIIFPVILFWQTVHTLTLNNFRSKNLYDPQTESNYRLIELDLIITTDASSEPGSSQKTPILENAYLK